MPQVLAVTVVALLALAAAQSLSKLKEPLIQLDSQAPAWVDKNQGLDDRCYREDKYQCQGNYTAFCCEFNWKCMQTAFQCQSMEQYAEGNALSGYCCSSTAPCEKVVGSCKVFPCKTGHGPTACVNGKCICGDGACADDDGGFLCIVPGSPAPQVAQEDISELYLDAANARLELKVEELSEQVQAMHQQHQKDEQGSYASVLFLFVFAVAIAVYVRRTEGGARAVLIQ